jgi:hypothetical protein
MNTNSDTLERAWSVGLLAVLAALFFYGFTGAREPRSTQHGLTDGTRRQPL